MATCSVKDCSKGRISGSILCSPHELAYSNYVRRMPLPLHRSGWAKKRRPLTAKSEAPPVQPSALGRVKAALKTLSVTGRERNRPDLVDAAADAMAALTSLVSEVRAEERERAAKYIDERAAAIEQGGGLASEWIARCYRDEAKAIRALR